jgi:energy-coupling factor transporter ATP-binding protein EcfA2
VHLKRITLQDVRGFRTLDFSFGAERESAGLWVITGDNASGKTALLKAIALAVIGPSNARDLHMPLAGWIRQTASFGKIEAELWKHPSDHHSGVKGNRGSVLTPKIELQSTPRGDVFARGESDPNVLYGPWTESPSGWLCCGYGPFRRLYGAASETLEKHTSWVGDRLGTLATEGAALAECVKWLKDLHHHSLDTHRPNAKEAGTLLSQALKLLNEDFLSNGLTVNRVDSDGVWIDHPDGRILRLEELSDGYRSSLAMMFDIVSHIAYECDKKLELRQVHGQSVVDYPGIVLIDELDAHLHPEWQRRIGFWLKHKFPQMQFIVTTHSPLVCQAADGLFHLPGPGKPEQPSRVTAEELTKIVSGRPAEILYGPAFEMRHTRSPLAVQYRAEYSRLVSKKRVTPLTAKETSRLDQLSRYVNGNSN